MTELEIFKQTLDTLGMAYEYEEGEAWGLDGEMGYGEYGCCEDDCWEVPVAKRIIFGYTDFYFDVETEKFIAWWDGESIHLEPRLYKRNNS